jgi:predicted O-methyltransferase YrrM
MRDIKTQTGPNTGTRGYSGDGEKSKRMNPNKKKFILKLLPVADVLLAPLVYPAAWLLKLIRLARVDRLPHCRQALWRIGVFPIRDHYYEPQIDNRNPGQPFSRERELPGIDWNINGQLNLLGSFSFAQELADIPQDEAHAREFAGTREFYVNNPAFASGDAEYWYQLIRLLKPKRIFEIGSGHSTLMAIKAIRKNQEQDSAYSCRHVCIEPYEMPWLEATGVKVVRQKVEDLAVEFFSELAEDDILFIDSSHVIRPQGDVLFEYLELLPTLNKGVVVHLHDIFSPRNYLGQWLEEEVKFWNEQYLMEAFLSQNHDWQILGALNYLRHNHYDKLKSVAPFLTPDSEPVSFYIQKLT